MAQTVQKRKRPSAATQDHDGSDEPGPSKRPKHPTARKSTGREKPAPASVRSKGKRTYASSRVQTRLNPSSQANPTPMNRKNREHSGRSVGIAPVHLHYAKYESISGAQTCCYAGSLSHVWYVVQSRSQRSSTEQELQVREIALDMMTDTNYEMSDAGLRWQSSAILALQEATEAFLVHLFEDAYVPLSSLSRLSLNQMTQEFVRHTRKTRNNHAARYPACSKNKRAMGRFGVGAYERL
jgi:histone H3-like centromeric protein A